MDKALIKIAEQYEKTAEMLLQRVKVLRSGIDPSKCIHGEYTGEPFKGCKTCGNTVRVKCKFQEYGYVNSGRCNPARCDKFEAESQKLTKL